MSREAARSRHTPGAHRPPTRVCSPAMAAIGRNEPCPERAMHPTVIKTITGEQQLASLRDSRFPVSRPTERSPSSEVIANSPEVGLLADSIGAGRQQLCAPFLVC
jgi:hypothetical protein